MSTSTIGALQFRTISGKFPINGLVSHAKERPGHNGVVRHFVGERGTITTVNALGTYASTGALATAVTAACAIQGTTVYAYDDLGVQHGPQYVERVEPGPIEQRVNDSESENYHIVIAFTLQNVPI